MRITEGKLRQIIRTELIRESFTNKVAIATLGNTSTGPVYVVAYRPDELEAILQSEESDDEQRSYNSVVAGVSFNKSGIGYEAGECNDAWRVWLAASNERGRGTQVYLAALDSLRNSTSDRFGVSPAAERMWKKLARYDFVEREEFDDINNPKTPPTSDDCHVFPRRDPALNSSWRIKGDIPPEVKRLVDLGNRHLLELGKAGQRQKAEYLLTEGFHVLFQDLYDEYDG